MTGLYLTISGVIKYIICAGLSEREGGTAYGNTCHTNGPGGVGTDVMTFCQRHHRLCAYLKAGDFLGLVALCWIAFAYLPYSHCQVRVALSLSRTGLVESDSVFCWTPPPPHDGCMDATQCHDD